MFQTIYLPTHYLFIGKCTSLGEQYRWIDDKCYYFEKTKKTFTSAQSNCQNVFGANSNGKLIEPATMSTFDKILLEVPSLLSNRDFHVGIQKINNRGSLKYSSTGTPIPEDFWRGASRDVQDGMHELYICYYPNQIKWHDCNNHELASVCEFSIEPDESPIENQCESVGLYHKIDNITISLDEAHQDSNGM